MAPLNTTPAPWNIKSGGTLYSKGEAQRFARQIVESQDYRDSLHTRIKMGTLAPGVEQMLWYYAYGKPIEQVQLNVTKEEDLSTLSIEELQQKAAAIKQQLDDAAALAEAIPASFTQVA